MENAKNKLKSLNTPKTYINIAISLAIMIIFRFIPAPAPITEMGMQIIGIFFAMIWAWITVDIAWSTLFYLVMLGATTDYDSVVNVVKSGLAHNGVLLAFFVMIFTSVFNVSGTSKFLAGRIVSMKIGKGRPYVLLILISAASFIVGAVVEPVPAIIMIWAIVYAMSDILGYKPGDSWPLIACMVAFFNIDRAYILFPFRSSSQAGVSLYTTLSGQEMPFFPYFLWALIVSVVGSALVLLAIRFIIKPDMSRIREAGKNVMVYEKASPYQKYILVVTVLLTIALIIPNIMPSGWFITKILNSLGNHGIVMLGIVVLLAPNFKGGISFEQMMSGVIWKVIFIMAGGIALATSMMSEGAGIIAFLTERLSPLFEGMSGFAFIAILFLIIAVLTQFCNSLAVLTAFTPIAYGLAEGTGMLASGFMGPLIVMVVTFASSMAIWTPAGCAPAAIIHGNREWIPAGKLRSFFIFGLPIIGMITGILVGYPIGMLIF